MIRNGEILAERFSDTPYVFQNIHTLNHRARYTDQHIALLNHSAQELFGEQLANNISAERIESQIGELLTANRLTRNASICVELRLDAVGNYELRSHEPSLYSGYVLRSLHPNAVCLPLDMPLPQHPTSAAAATRLMADTIARKRGFHTAIIAERDGGLAIDPLAPLFTVKEYTLFAQEGCHSVEASITIEAARRAGMSIEHKRLTATDLNDADEVFTACWQGITSMAHIGKRIYMSIMAEKIAIEMEAAAKSKR